ncbi:MAG: tRNA (adenosine(37)-N6)-threonylcarbamoyltransferase complex transferase subunit TsaD [Methylacidiphilales bacterium]|nr:tRNA (adenosine(37)-N6)-threonylcarbamoyltransferase complex transferase subunit TsaD [Candidatus Methylacidiphilales bacterium]
MRVLGIETSCDETSVSVVEKEGGRLRILQNEIASQIEQHRPFGGVVPELATRQHLLRLDPMVRELAAAGIPDWQSIDGIAVTAGPGLASALLVGVSYAKALAFALGKPWLAVNHMEGHLFSPFLSNEEVPVCPHVALIVSGGHTLLLHVREPFNYKLLGRTQDDAAGEAFDKVAKLLGLPYPGGPEVEKAAREGNPSAVDFPRSMLDSGDFNFSFSGLKTAVRIHLQRHPGISAPDVCASFQQAILDVLVAKTLRAAKHAGVKIITVSGGVSCNRALRDAMEAAAKRHGMECRVADPGLSTDNAAMIAAVGACRLEAGLSSPWDFDIDPNWKLAE